MFSNTVNARAVQVCVIEGTYPGVPDTWVRGWLECSAEPSPGDARTHPHPGEILIHEPLRDHLRAGIDIVSADSQPRPSYLLHEAQSGCHWH